MADFKAVFQHRVWAWNAQSRQPPDCQYMFVAALADRQYRPDLKIRLPALTQTLAQKQEEHFCWRDSSE